MMNYNQARYNMIQQQIRTWNVLDPKIIELLNKVNREEFVSCAYRKLAFSDTQIPIANGQFMLPPREEARMLQALDIKPTEKVLEIGTGSGFMTALLANLAKEVISVEWYKDILSTASKNLKATKLTNYTLEEGDGSKGWLSEAPFDVICVTGSVHQLPSQYLEQLNENGRICAIIGDSPTMETTIITKLANQQIKQEVLYETDVLPLIHAEKPKEFIF